MRGKRIARLATIVFSAVTAFAAGEPNSHKATSDRAGKLFVEACTACHTLDRVRSQRLTSEEWRGTIAGMISEGIALTDEEVDLVVAYLTTHFGPDTP
jgi:mono/diheme cytochrome c family protein